jgi:hypothetical protein
MRRLLFLFLLFPVCCFAKITYTVDMGAGNVFVAQSNGCADVLVALNAYLESDQLVAVSCDVDPLVPPFPRVIRFANGMMWEVQGMVVQQSNADGDGCVPSVRTVPPCPSGFAPSSVAPLSDDLPDPYLSDFDKMPIQDMLYAIGVCLFGVLGIAVGVRLS